MKKNHIVTLFCVIAVTGLTGQEQLFPILEQSDDSSTIPAALPLLSDDAQTSTIINATSVPVVQHGASNSFGLPMLESSEVNSALPVNNTAGDDYRGQDVRVRGSGNAIALLNAFIASIAPESPWLKKEISRSSERQVAPGLQVGYSKNLGRFTYRPKTWTDLTQGQRQLIIKDSRLKPFLISMRQTENQEGKEWNYGEPHPGARYAEGFIEREVEKMKYLVEEVRQERDALVQELKAAIELVRTEFGSLKSEQDSIIDNLNASVADLQIKQDEALNALGESIADLRTNQEGIMEELNDSVAVAIEEHRLILRNLREHKDSFNAEWNAIRRDVYGMMTQAQPLEVVTRGQGSIDGIGPSRVIPSDQIPQLEPIYSITEKDDLLGDEHKPAAGIVIGKSNPMEVSRPAESVVSNALRNVNSRTPRPDDAPDLKLFIRENNNKVQKFILRIEGQALIRGNLI